MSGANNNEHLLAEVKKLIDKAEKSRQAHFTLAQKYGFLAKILHSVILIGSSLVAVFTFANYKCFLPIIPYLTQEGFTLFIGSLAIFVFVIGVFEEYARWRDTGSIHEDIGKKLTSFIRSADAIYNNPQINVSDVNYIRTWYQIINETSPIIPDKVFLKSKQNFLQKVAISKELDNNPFKSISEITKEIEK